MRGDRIILQEQRVLETYAGRESIGISVKRAGSIIDLSSLTAADVKHDAGVKPVKVKKIRVDGGPDPDDDPNKKDVDKKGRAKKDKRSDADKRRAAKDANRDCPGGKKNAIDAGPARKDDVRVKNDVKKKSGRDEHASKRRANKKPVVDRKNDEPRGGRRGGGDNNPPGKRPLFGAKANEEPPDDDSDENPTARGRNKRHHRGPPDDDGDDSGDSSGSGVSDSRSRDRQRKYRRVADVEDELREIFAEDRFVVSIFSGPRERSAGMEDLTIRRYARREPGRSGGAAGSSVELTNPVCWRVVCREALTVSGIDPQSRFGEMLPNNQIRDAPRNGQFGDVLGLQAVKAVIRRECAVCREQRKPVLSSDLLKGIIVHIINGATIESLGISDASAKTKDVLGGRVLDVPHGVRAANLQASTSFLVTSAHLFGSGDRWSPLLYGANADGSSLDALSSTIVSIGAQLVAHYSKGGASWERAILTLTGKQQLVKKATEVNTNLGQIAILALQSYGLEAFSDESGRPKLEELMSIRDCVLMDKNTRIWSTRSRFAFICTFALCGAIVRSAGMLALAGGSMQSSISERITRFARDTICTTFPSIRAGGEQGTNAGAVTLEPSTTPNAKKKAMKTQNSSNTPAKLGVDVKQGWFRPSWETCWWETNKGLWSKPNPCAKNVWCEVYKQSSDFPLLRSFMSSLEPYKSTAKAWTGCRIEWVTRNKKKANCSFGHSAALTKDAMEHVLRRAPNKQLWESSEKMKDQRVDWENGKFDRMIEEE